MGRKREGGGGGSEGGWRKNLSRTNFVSGVAAMGCRSNQPWLVIPGHRLPAVRPDSFPCGNQRRWSSGSGYLGISWIAFPDRYYPVKRDCDYFYILSTTL
ncbi:hypothetical protein BO83DRAFT_412472 [Aspergillus eucalypticola CBS 122712]|uniref:Uncharacterized protein n=1 Tax=Aspergillus eucalypticola (strain CBS 122712 / IBT 29274) TaxID=1448314 RepID=A0A317UKY7_ASPEC|nr:uncharacterized protein BO83DRAFT_412472 [Aspergillus eucalypticola CBS 122712]PWY62653.1 hypothetical protein BO83DRAFT_412472 [Aspergillus eucalypticola CBS 122712]